MVKNTIKNSFIEVIYFDFDNEIYLDKIEIAEEFRGQGYGTEFMKDFMKKAKKPIRLVLNNNARAGFYTRLGFKLNKMVGKQNSLEYIYKGGVK